MSYPCPSCETELKKITSKKNNQQYWLCSDKHCNYITSDNEGRPAPKISKAEAPSNIVCPNCESSMYLISGGKHGVFYSCMDYPDCRGTIDIDAPDCPNCGVAMVKRRKKDDESEFWGCRQYPDCKATLSV